MELSITLAPNGGLRIQVPNAKRTLDIPIDYVETVECPCCGERSRVPVSSSALRTFKRIIVEAEEYRGKPQPGHIGAFPTQAVVDAWLRQDREDKAKAAAQAARDAAAARGIDLDALDIKL